MKPSAIHIHAPRPDEVKAVVGHCPECDGRRVFIVSQYQWYDHESVCLGCGNRWSGQECLPAQWGGRDAGGRFDGGRFNRLQEVISARKRYRQRARPRVT